MADGCEKRGLFIIRVVDKETDEIIHHAEVVAEGEKEALFESDLKEVLKKRKLKRDEVYVLVREFAPIPAKEEVKRVKIISRIGKGILAKEE